MRRIAMHAGLMVFVLGLMICADARADYVVNGSFEEPQHRFGGTMASEVPGWVRDNTAGLFGPWLLGVGYH
jgi:hypothetical protein